MSTEFVDLIIDPPLQEVGKSIVKCVFNYYEDIYNNNNNNLKKVLESSISKFWYTGEKDSNPSKYTMMKLTKIPQDCAEHDNYINIILIKYTGRHNTILSMILHVIEFLKIKTDLLDPRIWAQILLRPRSRST